MNTRKISILLPDLRGGGAERVNLDLAHEFAKAGHEVDFVLRQARGELIEEAQSAHSVSDLAVPRVRKLLPKLVKYLRTQKPDVLIAAMWPLSVIAPLAQRLSGHRCEVLVSEHGILSKQYGDWGLLHRLFLRSSTGLGYRIAGHRVGVSAGVAADMAALSGMRRRAFEVIYNPVPARPDPDPSALDQAERLWPGPSGARILTVGTLKAVKNHPLLLRAFAQFNRPDAQLMFVGDGVGREDLISLARDLGVGAQVVFAGFQSDPTPFYITADLFVLSSDREGFGNVIVEAMACGTPVVSTDCPSGPGEILEGGQYGRLTPVGDVKSLAIGMKESLAVPVPKDALKQRAGYFSPERAAQKYLDLISPES